MAVTLNYTGRLVDLFIVQGIKVSGDQLVLPGFGGDEGGRVIAGVEKIAQTWAILFLTELGSVQYNPQLGSSFVTNYRLGLIRDESDVQSEFGLAASQANDQMFLAAQAAPTPLPADEQLATSELLRFTIDRNQGKLALYVRLTSQAGTKHDILLPIPVAIQ